MCVCVCNIFVFSARKWICTNFTLWKVHLYVIYMLFCRFCFLILFTRITLACIHMTAWCKKLISVYMASKGIPELENWIKPSTIRFCINTQNRIRIHKSGIFIDWNFIKRAPAENSTTLRVNGNHSWLGFALTWA